MHIKQSEQTTVFQQIFETAPIGIAVVTRDGHWVKVNSSWCECLGYSSKEIMLLDIKKLLFENDWYSMLEALNSNLYEGSTSQSFEREYHHHDGSVIWLSIQLTALKDTFNEEIIYYCIHMIDISGRKETEQQILQMTESQRSALMGSWEWDVGKCKMTFTQQFADIYQWTMDGVNQQDLGVLDLVQDHERERFKESIDEILQEGNDLNFEFHKLLDHENLQYLHLRGFITKDEEGRPVRLNGTVQDVTDRKKVELELQETVERYTSLKKYNHDTVISLDLNGVIINSNGRAEELTGYSINELVGRNISKLIGDVHLESVLSYSLSNVTRENKNANIVHKLGHRVDVIATIVPIIIRELNVGFYILIKDMTEHKRLLIEKETAESMSKAKDQFVTMMSHEIRTPITGLIGMGELLLETTQLDAQQREYVEIMRKSSDSLINIINDILDFSKIESGKIELQDVHLDVRECVTDTLNILSTIAEKKKIGMSAFINPNVPYVCMGDPERLKQVLINLIGNAVKFTFSGEISISVELTPRTDHNMDLKFLIKDTGIGIPQEKVKNLFEPFNQVDHILTRTHEGTGLGLTISKRLVELMGGELKLEESNEKGTTFVFTIHLKKTLNTTEITEPKFPNDETPKGINSIHILIAEDNEINQLVLKIMLEKQGYTTNIVSNGHEVIQALADEHYDIIFMDIQMPGMNGFEVTAWIKETIPSNLCPIIIAVTANALKGDREKCLAAGMDNYLSKPIKLTALKEVIERYY
ncbi:PAS domain S-box protein [Paenibacillus crassostreae]|nr:PAS domain S-box protein [Paenibacillus crassostreae]